MEKTGHVENCGQVCGDGRFELIDKIEKDIIRTTNITKDEEKVLSNILFRLWQRDWLRNSNDIYDMEAKSEAYDRLMSGGKKAIEETCKAFKISDIGEFSDGFHTFNSLYHQRAVLFATLVNTYSSHSWKSYRHEDGQICFGGGWFIVGIDTPKGSYTYHYENKYWDMFNCQTYENAKHWDGHTDDDVERLLTLPDGWETKGD